MFKSSDRLRSFYVSRVVSDVWLSFLRVGSNALAAPIDHATISLSTPSTRASSWRPRRTCHSPRSSMLSRFNRTRAPLANCSNKTPRFSPPISRSSRPMRPNNSGQTSISPGFLSYSSGEIELKIEEQVFKVKSDLLQVKRYQKTVHGS